jgi:hypothetical protein
MTTFSQVLPYAVSSANPAAARPLPAWDWAPTQRQFGVFPRRAVKDVSACAQGQPPPPTIWFQIQLPREFSLSFFFSVRTFPILLLPHRRRWHCRAATERRRTPRVARGLATSATPLLQLLPRLGFRYATRAYRLAQLFRLSLSSLESSRRHRRLPLPWRRLLCSISDHPTTALDCAPSCR